MIVVPVETLRVALAATSKGACWMVLGGNPARPVYRAESREDAEQFIQDRLRDELMDGEGLE